jgi:excinuclease ABC subunit A
MGASKHNLENVDVDIPLHALVAITGVSGAGKSTLVHDVLETLLKKEGKRFISLSQSPVGHTLRSDISTYVDLLTPIRYFFAALPEAKIRGLTPAHFSFNHRYGMCKKCYGMGTISIDLQFLPTVRTDCPSCKGSRLNPLSLEVKYKGKNLGDLFLMTIRQLKDFLPPISKVIKTIDLLTSFGLDYLELGRETASLSGGEASRLRLSKELTKPAKEHTFYLFDEPSSGLHDSDIDRILPLFHKIVDQGHSLLFIEHNLTMIANADFVIDMGPGPGPSGGKIVATGPPPSIAKLATPTGKFLKKFFSML